MTPEQITFLLSARDTWLCVRDECVNWEAVAEIESVLREVPPGIDNRVDLALGRRCAVLPPRAQYNISREVSKVNQLIDTTRQLWRKTKSIEY